MNINQIQVKYLGLQPYEDIWRDMQAFTESRNEDTPDEIWCVQHPAVFTLGRNGKESHILFKTNTPIVKVDRGGQVTFHGPGQAVCYVMCNLRRRKLNIRQLVVMLEDAIITVLEKYGLEARGDRQAPGVYIGDEKIAALGLRVRRGCTFHGLSLNVNMDLTPFSQINPCGYEGLKVTQLKDKGVDVSVDQVLEQVSTELNDRLSSLVD